MRKIWSQWTGSIRYTKGSFTHRRKILPDESTDIQKKMKSIKKKYVSKYERHYFLFLTSLRDNSFKIIINNALKGLSQI